MEVTMTPEERAEFEAFKAEKERKEALQRAKDDREAYKNLVEDQIETVFPRLLETSDYLRDVKQNCMRCFDQALKMKADLFNVKDDQRSHTFTNAEGTRRIILGYYITDNYRDTVNEGIAIIKEVIASLARDKESEILVEAVLRLLSKDQKGNLKASRVLQLRKMADQLANERFAEGVRIIEEAFQPEQSKQFIRAEYKNEIGMWVNVPLGMTEA
ncbi:MAG: DUF3164 family protein [Bacteroidales bacterium]|jgi:hypothetical protein|nr:DUF3164 family protein [Bacteroidales bacterium]